MAGNTVNFYSTLAGEQHVAISLSVCFSVHEHISGTAGHRSSSSRDMLFTEFCVQIHCGLVLFWRRCDTLCTSRFMDDVTFGRNGPICVAILERSLMSMNALLHLKFGNFLSTSMCADSGFVNIGINAYLHGTAAQY